MMEVSMKNLLLQMESNSIRDSCMRFCSGEERRIEAEGGGRESKDEEEREGERNRERGKVSLRAIKTKQE